MTIKDRIELFIKRQGIRRSTFEKACGFSNGYTRNLKENPSAAKIEDILNNYPELNRVWLLSGEGEMLCGDISAEGARHEAEATVADGENCSEITSRFLKLLEKKDEQIERKDEQIDRLLTLLEAAGRGR